MRKICERRNRWFSGSLLHNLYDFPNHISYFLVSQVSCFVQNDVLIRGEQTVGPYIAFLLETAGLEILILERNCIAVSDSLTGYLTKQEIVSFQYSYHQGGTSLSLS